MQTLDTFLLKDPFPHMIVENFYNDDELKLIWEELDFYTKDEKLFDAHEFGGVVDKTNSTVSYTHLTLPTNREV